MSYCRFGEADVYVMERADTGEVECLHMDSGSFVGGRVKMIEHLAKHRTAGHYVPSSVLKMLSAEIMAGKL